MNLEDDVGEKSEPLRWGVQRRLEFIDFRLFWYGRFNRRALTDTFGISPQQASADIRLYQDIAGPNLAYDSAQKSYQRAAEFKTAFMRDAAERYLLQAA